MAYCFGDGFDLYATNADTVLGYWDSGLINANSNLTTGRFASSQSLRFIGAVAGCLVKSSGANDAVHHIVCAYQQTAALTGTTLGLYFQLSDGATNQCCIVFRSDGVILLTSATPAGTVLATYSGAVTAANTWTAFEFEVIISPTVGRFRARKNGNTSDDFDSGATLPTRPGANSYANKLTVGTNASVNSTLIDDLLWRSDAVSVPFVGDIRAYTRMPASDVQAQFSRSSLAPQLVVSGGGGTGVTNGTARYVSFVPNYTGTIGTVTTPFSGATTCNMKCSIFASSGSAPTTVLGSATPIALSAATTGTWTFGTPVAVTKGTQYWIGFDSDATSGTFAATTGNTHLSSVTAYVSFPVASPVTVAGQGPTASVVVTPGINAELVSETLQDAATSYVYDSTVGHGDLYGIAALPATPVSVVAVTTRGFIQKSDAGTRNGAVQLKSGATTVQSTSTALSSSWGWLWRTDATDPATSAAWTPVAVSNVSIGPVCTL